jgi:3'-phosphoadenosine 5'-phosphosulfate sulfotransferase (PAPS reductase)/FAD synthetase
MKEVASMADQLIDLFSIPEASGEASAPVPCSDPVANAHECMTAMLLAGHPVQLQFSGGKDSSCCANLLLNAAREVVLSGKTCPSIYICSADTGVENPVVRTLADHELQKMKTFASEHKIPVEVHVGRPTLAASYAPRVIGGRALPPFPVGKRDCTTDWKIVVSQRVSRTIRAAAGGFTKPLVTVIGTRSSESAARLINTARRGESATSLWYGPGGEARLSPILSWTTDDVWTYLGECASGLRVSYSDFADLIEFYSAAAGGECVVVADMRQSQSAACGARSGCWVCGAVQNDKSVENMIASHPERYAYLAPLLRFRNFVVDSQWDWSLRNYLGRSIDADGCMAVKADQFSPQMCERLLRYLLTAQDRANSLGSPVPVRAVGLRELFAIDFYWSVRAWHPPFHALWVYFDHMSGNHLEAPIIESPMRPSQVPEIGKIFVGRDWDDGSSPLQPSGLRDPMWELHSESCGPSLRTGIKGNVFLALDEMPEFTVDEEGACMFLDFEAEEAIRKYHTQTIDWTIAASIYLRYGVVTLGRGQSSGIDDMMRRSQWLQRNQLHGLQQAEDLRHRCVELCATQEHLFA